MKKLRSRDGWSLGLEYAIKCFSGFQCFSIADYVYQHHPLSAICAMGKETLKTPKTLYGDICYIKKINVSRYWYL